MCNPVSNILATRDASLTNLDPISEQIIHKNGHMKRKLVSDSPIGLHPDIRKNVRFDIDLDLDTHKYQVGLGLEFGFYIYI